MLKYLILLLVCGYSLSAITKPKLEEVKNEKAVRAIPCVFWPNITNPYKNPGFLATDHGTMGLTAQMKVQYCAYNEQQSFWTTPGGMIIPSKTNGAIGKYYSAGIAVQVPGMAQYQCYNITLYISSAQANTYAVNGDEGIYYFTVMDNFCGSVNTSITLKLSGEAPVFSSGNAPPQSVLQVNSSASFQISFCLPRLNSNFVQRVFWNINQNKYEILPQAVLHEENFHVYRFQGGTTCTCTDPLNNPLPFDPTSCWTAVLSVLNVRPFDAGTYGVELVNYAGTVSTTWNVYVGGATIMPTGLPCNVNILTSDLIFILDSSINAGQQGFSAQIQLLNNILMNYNVGPNNGNVQVAVITYTTTAFPVILLNYNSNTQALLNAVNSIQYTGLNGQNIYAALQMVQNVVMNQNNGYRSFANHQIFLFSSVSYTGQNPQNIAATLIGSGINIYAIGWTSQANIGQLQSITGMANRVTQVNSWNNNALQTVATWIEQDTCGMRN